MSHLHFKTLSGDINWSVYGGSFVSRKCNNGDFDFYYVIEVTNMWDATGDESQDQYYVCLKAVSPDSVSQENIDSALSSCGMNESELESPDPLILVEALSSYGIFAVLWQDSSNNIARLMREAHKQVDMLESFTFGFAMDRAENGIGQDGWQLIRGQDVREFLAESR